jgi:serine protease Do
MRGCFVMSVVWLTMLFGFAQASQNAPADRQPWVFSSEDSGTNSYLGVDIADITSERMNALKLKEEKGVEVTMVDQDAPAGKAGIREHDVIVSMNGTSVDSGAQLRRMIHETPPGRVVTFGLSRDGQPLTVKVQLADKHKEFAFVPPRGEFHVQVPEIHVPDIDIPAMHMIMVTSSARSGLTVENITPQLGEFFGVKNGNGVLVRAVEKGSRAERAGFHAGDVIVKINGQQVHDTSDFSHAVRDRNGNSVNVGVMRDKKEQNLTLTLPSQKDSGELLNEETFGGEPLIRAESELELTKLQDYVAKLRPETQLAADTMRKASEEVREAVRKETCQQQKELRRQTEKQRQQMQKDLQQLRIELRQLREDWL